MEHAQMALTPAEQSIRGRVAAHVKWSKNDPVEGTSKARAAFDKRFLDEVDPNRELPEAERLRRAQHARSAYFARLALASAKSRRQRRAS